MSLFQQSTMECGGDYKSKISLSCHKLSLLLGYVYKAIRKVKEVRSVKWLTILTIPGLMLWEQAFVQWNNLTLTVSPLKVILNRSAEALESSQLQGSHSKYKTVIGTKESYYRLPGIMNSQTCFSTGNKQ